MKLNTNGLATSLLLGAVLVPSVDGLTQESHRFSTEAEKLVKMREIVRTHDFIDSPDQPKACAPLLSALRSDTSLDAIEPDMRINSIDDPRLKKWNDCPDTILNKSLPPGEYGLLFEGLEISGGHPPYRIYRLELDGNKTNGPEEVIYHEFDFETGHTGYSWIDTQRCAIKTYIEAESRSFSAKPVSPNRYWLNTLFRYRGEPVVLSVFDTHIADGGTEAYAVKADWLRPQKHFPDFCSWIPK